MLLPAAEGGIERRMATLMEVARLLNSSRVLEEVLRLTLEWATRVMDSEAGSVILLDRQSDELVIKVATGPKGQEAQGKRFRKGEGSIRSGHLPPEVRQGAPAGPGEPPPIADNTLEGVERAQIARALREAKGNQSRAARLLGISREKLRYRMRKYGLGTRRGGA